MTTRLALLKTRFVRLVRGQGAIRLEDDDAEVEKGLPWVLSGDEADDEGYTSRFSPPASRLAGVCED